jgi:hypothetical protein
MSRTLTPTFKNEPGWLGAFTRDEHPDGLPNGARVRKIDSEPGDGQPDGALGTILGSLGHPDLGIAYFIEWDAIPRMAVVVVAKKVQLLRADA